MESLIKSKADVGITIRNIRELRGLSQGEVSKYINVSQAKLSKIETGSQYLRADTVLRFAQLFKLTVEEIMIEADND